MAEIAQKLRPWLVPNYALLDVAPRPAANGKMAYPSVTLAKLPAETLAQMCDEFRAAVFAKAGVADPEKGVE